MQKQNTGQFRNVSGSRRRSWAQSRASCNGGKRTAVFRNLSRNDGIAMSLCSH
jgi:hypothetical protein